MSVKRIPRGQSYKLLVLLHLLWTTRFQKASLLIMFGGGRNLIVALHLYSIVCEGSRETNVRDLTTIPSLDSTGSPSLIPSSVTILFPMESYQSMVGVLRRCGDFRAIQVRMKVVPSLGEIAEEVTLSDSALSGLTETIIMTHEHVIFNGNHRIRYNHCGIISNLPSTCIVMLCS